MDVYNVKMTIPLSFREDYQNYSDIYFKTPPRFKIVESVFNDKETQSNYKRSFANVIIDDLQTIGGNVSFGEVSYNQRDSKSDDKKSLGIFKINNEGTGSEAIRQHISNVDVVGLDDVYDSGPGSGSDWIGDFSDDNINQIGNWNTHSYSNSFVTQSFINSYATLISDGTHISNIFRYARDEEEYEISYRISGSGGIQVKESPIQTDLTQSLSSVSNDTLNLITVYSQSFTDFNPVDNTTWTSSYLSDNLKRDNIISGSNDAIITGSFVISSGSYASIYISSNDTCSVFEPSIKPKNLKGINPPFYFYKLPIPMSDRRNQTSDFELKLMNSNMNSSINVVDDLNISVTSSNFFTGSPFILVGN